MYLKRARKQSYSQRMQSQEIFPSPRSQNIVSTRKTVKSYAPYSKRKSKYAPKVTSIVQQSYLGTIQSTVSTDTLTVLKFNLDDMPGYADLAAVFDQYKIDKVELRFVPNANTNPTVLGAQTQTRSRLYTAFDANDATVPATLNELIQYQNCSQTPYLEEYRRTIYPRLAVNSSDEEGVVTLGPANSWCATSQKDVDWYGLKIGASANGITAGTIQTWMILAKFYISLKNIK